MSNKKRVLERIQMVSVIIFLIAVFCAVDLGINFASALVPTLNDGMGFRSFLHTFFRIFGDGVVQLEDFFFAFQKALWFAFFMLVENVVVEVWKRKI